ncbi:hypothetical protein PMAYCL1PPCAC_22999 [Pristionchus mayeri]|uniref:Uncharacterized protein n=1 Tax=Pristionchus mayeri TaxID=1317129 RepID=A0AAN5CYI7_9BILA|nr:hypothetical protein PMAYCL1PPCAC_22999 [Pristionchus mayeri]
MGLLDLVEVKKGALVAGKVSDILGLGHTLSDLLGSLDLTELDQRISGTLEGVREKLGSLGVSLSSSDGSNLHLLGLLYEVLSLLGLLLSHLLHFDGLSELATEAEAHDGDVVEKKTELGSTLTEGVRDLLGDLLTLSDHVLSVETYHDGLKHFIGDRGQNTLGVVKTDVEVDGRKLRGVRAVQNTQSDLHVLQIYKSGDGRNSSGSRSDIEVDGSLHPGDDEVRPLTNDFVLHSGEPIEDNSALSSVNYK